MECLAESPGTVSGAIPVPRTSPCAATSQQSLPHSQQGTKAEPIAPSAEAWDFSEVYESLCGQYRRTRAPIEVNFRKLAPFNSGVDRLTHLIHSYPAKVLLNIPLFFLHCDQMGDVGHLRDPFCGSGTVLLEGVVRGWSVSGADCNPLARLISRVKLTSLDVEEISAAAKRACDHWNRGCQPFLPVVDVNYWFANDAQKKLGGLNAAIAREKNQRLQDFLYVCLSSCVRKASFADPRLSVPVRAAGISAQWTDAERYDVVELFKTAVSDNSRRVAMLSGLQNGASLEVPISTDARRSTEYPLSNGCVDLVITSPPYVGAQKYIRATSLNLGWLGLVPTGRLRDLEEESIGREHYRKKEYEELVLPKHGVAHKQLKKIKKRNPLRAHIASNFLVEMTDALSELVRVVRKGGKVILVVGNNTVAGEEFKTSDYIRQLSVASGLRMELELVDDIRSRGLMTKRNRTAGLISREYIQVYSKP